MKSQYVLLTLGLTIAMTMPTFGQGAQDDTTTRYLKRHDPSSMMGKPTADVTVDGLHMKVWLMTQVQHKEMMKDKMDQMMMPGGKEGSMGQMGRNDTTTGMGKGMKEMKRGDMRMNMAMKDSMMAGTHHIMLEAIDTASGKEIEDASVKVLITSPSKKKSSVELVSMMRHFGGALTLDEKGEYQVTVDVKSAGVTKSTRFQYTVK